VSKNHGATEQRLEVRCRHRLPSGFELDFDFISEYPNTALFGPSGAGKTSLLMALAGFLTPDEGRLEVLGTDVGGFDEDGWAAFRRNIGMLFQFGALLNSLNVHDNIALPLVESGVRDQALIRSLVRMKLAMVGLSGVESLVTSQLSGGMKKRVGLARAMILDPEVLFLDEPSSGLDPVTAAGLDALISDLPRLLGTSMVVVTHDLASAARVADRILIMDGGTFVAAGRPEEITESDLPIVRGITRRIEIREDRVADTRVAQAFD
jgi:phospholipid/cholesterol/gamma-HCH transport system ATP-binding protein